MSTSSRMIDEKPPVSRKTTEKPPTDWTIPAMVVAVVVVVLLTLAAFWPRTDSSPGDLRDKPAIPHND